MFSILFCPTPEYFTLSNSWQFYWSYRELMNSWHITIVKSDFHQTIFFARCDFFFCVTNSQPELCRILLNLNKRNSVRIRLHCNLERTCYRVICGNVWIILSGSTLWNKIGLPAAFNAVSVTHRARAWTIWSVEQTGSSRQIEPSPRNPVSNC